MSELLSIIGMQTELDYLIGDIAACFGDTPLAIPKVNIPSDKQKYQPKEQHEFTIKSVKIMVASKKDAVKKYNHSKKQSVWNKNILRVILLCMTIKYIQLWMRLE